MKYTYFCGYPKLTNYFMKRYLTLLCLALVSLVSNAVQVTFNVDMSSQVVSPNGVHVAGSFQNWDPAATELTNNGNGVYSITVDIPVGVFSYKFINGNDWPGEESVPSACGTSNGFGGYNRSYEIIGSTDVVLETVCFSSCSACPPPVNFIAVTFKVDMSQQTVSANGVHIAGSFQNWNPATSELTDTDNDGIYTGTFQIQEGIGINYKFINGNDWPFQEVVPMSCGEGDGFGGYNRHYALGSEDVEMNPVCFATCYPCTIIQEPTLVTVAFQVNMSNQTVSPDGVHIAGDFNGWNTSSSPMTAMGNGVYETSFEIPINTETRFRFINGTTWEEAETIPALCGVLDEFGSYNRNLQVFAIDTIFGPVCFNECADCLPVEPVLVTLRVDMTNETVSPDGVYVAGEFNNWDPTATAMSLYAPGQYEAVVVMNTGQTSQYKFLNGPDFSGEETVPADCGVSNGFGGFNRSVTAVSGSNTVPVVCFSSCGECVVIPSVNVTFRVNMSDVTVSANGVHVAGSFNNFSPSATEMTLVAPNIYSATVNVPENAQITYKFLNGNDWPFVETVPFECGVDDGFGGFNRTLTVDNSDVQTNIVCFGSCADCIINTTELGATSWSLFPIPATNEVFVANVNGNFTYVKVIDLMGREIMRVTTNGVSNIKLDVTTLANGQYVVQLPNGDSKLMMINR